MGMVQQAKRTLNNIWHHGDDEEEEYQDDDGYEAETISETRERETRDRDFRDRDEKTTCRPVHSGGGSGSGNARRMSGPVALPLRGREKNIYTLKPKTQEEASIAADYLKTGSAIVLNLDEVERMIAVRIIDFMSGVCYGLEHQGHAMKLGDTIFLFTPGDFEISSDESDYGENTEFFFKEMSQIEGESTAQAPALDEKTPERPAPTANSTTSTSIGAPHVERITERPTIERPSVERPTLPRSWER